MENLNEKPELTPEEIRKISLILTRKANLWYISRGRYSDGIQVFKTDIDDIFVIKDIETNIKLGMRKEGKDDDVVIKLSFFDIEDGEVDC